MVSFSRAVVLFIPLLLLPAGCSSPAPDPDSGPAVSFLPGGRVLLDAHNCYPYQGRWADRIDRALATGAPLAVEQDLVWFTDPETRRSWSLVSHGEELSGTEPTMDEYFFERIRPLVEDALTRDDRRDWPLVTLNLDLKTDEAEHHRAVWDLLGRYESWLTTALRTADAATVADLDVGPVLVLTGTSLEQEEVFHHQVPVGARLRLFGAVETGPYEADPPAGEVIVGRRTNYRRWFNSPWRSVESGGPEEAGEWTSRDEARLREIVRYAHDEGLWVRFYTLNGHSEEVGEAMGWYRGYNFGSLDAVEIRWRAALEAGVDFIATDQYEELASVMAGWRARTGSRTSERRRLRQD
jgi:hypothetical protein